MRIRPATSSDREAVWSIMEPTIRAGDTYPLPATLTRDESLDYWFDRSHEVFVAERADTVVGTYYLRANHPGGGSHVANCGYMTLASARGHGVGAAMCAHSLQRAKERGFLAMQFNFVVSTNTAAVHLWKKAGFAVVGVVPRAFRHPKDDLVDVFVMHRFL